MKTAGVLCPVASLPGTYGIGDFGASAYEFIDILAEMGVGIWQVLPLNSLGYGHSPYQPLSSFAGETSFIDLKSLEEDGYLYKAPEAFAEKSTKVLYEEIAAYKQRYFREAFETFVSMGEKPADYEAFIEEDWVKPYAIFAALKKRNGGRAWIEWPEEDKKGYTFEDMPEEIAYNVYLELFLQYEFRVQWLRILDYAHSKNIKIMGDIPIYVGHDSLDVYGDRDEFLLDSQGYPTSVAGVPPDYFSAVGQRWGNPIYNWQKIEENGFRFWKDRLIGVSKMFDLVRIDHFLAFSAFWQIPATCPTAMEGAWIPAPGYEMFDAVLPTLGKTQIVAEDLGLITDKVIALRDHYGFPGMNVIQFTINDPGFKMRKNMISYTGTHDNDTIESFYLKMDDYGRSQFDERLREKGIDPTVGKKHEQAVEFAMLLPTDTVIIPVQDILGFTNEFRTNCPGIVDDFNWTFKLADLTGMKARISWFKGMIEKGRRAETERENLI